MEELGNKITCYRGETFDLIRKFTDENGQPLMIPSWMSHPYIRITVKSNTFDVYGQWKKNYWLDMKDWPRLNLYEQFENNEIPNFGIAIEQTPEELDGITASDDRIYSRFHRSNESYNGVGPPSNAVTFSGLESGQEWWMEFPTAVKKGLISCKANSFGVEKFALEATSDDNHIWKTYEFPNTELTYFVLNNDTKIRISFTRSGAGVSAMPNVTVSNLKYVFQGNKDSIYYLITDDGREYYRYDEYTDSIVPYEFLVNKRFLNADTREWTAGIYKYEIALCDGELMTDWLTRNFLSLYSDVTPPTADEELVHYICKKAPHLLKDVNMKEPLVNYRTNIVLQAPSKLIVKEN